MLSIWGASVSGGNLFSNHYVKYNLRCVSIMFQLCEHKSIMYIMYIMYYNNNGIFKFFSRRLEKYCVSIMYIMLALFSIMCITESLWNK